MDESRALIIGVDTYHGSSVDRLQDEEVSVLQKKRNSRQQFTSTPNLDICPNSFNTSSPPLLKV